MTPSSDFTGVRWRKSSRSASSGECIELAWHKSSRSADTGECVELTHTETAFGIRDSKNADGPVLALGASHGLAFLKAVTRDRVRRS